MANIFTNLIANSDPSVPGACVGRAKSRVETYLTKMEASMKSKLSAVNTEANEVSVIAAFGGTANAGTFTLSVDLPTRDISYTTANIAYNAADSTIETALDSASPATVPDGDIVVAGSATNFTDGTMTFTCNGSANVSVMPVLITIADVNLSGTTPTVGAVTRSTPGRKNRNGHQAISDLNIAVGCTHDAGAAVTLTTAAAKYVGWSDRASLDVIKWLADVITVEEGTDYTKLQLEALYPELLNLS